ncbi:hypothetical protein NP233_g4344 [Leucocoprinus birnbaumii]|uniref:Uncharacterized protein n=1 Tax=Leucocoprinus birnbaumii TaxID=56174 RepID=A0AAD5YXB2_9AGAR|nr:hypothetical protein NP233_g4344 [Leucocoprinus birnbaumii]
MPAEWKSYCIKVERADFLKLTDDKHLVTKCWRVSPPFPTEVPTLELLLVPGPPFLLLASLSSHGSPSFSSPGPVTPTTGTVLELTDDNTSDSAEGGSQ